MFNFSEISGKQAMNFFLMFAVNKANSPLCTNCQWKHVWLRKLVFKYKRKTPEAINLKDRDGIDILRTLKIDYIVFDKCGLNVEKSNIFKYHSC